MTEKSDLQKKMTDEAHGMNEDKKKAIKALRTAQGQIGGIISMIENGRYCIDISNQIFASTAVLKRANTLMLRQHLEHCVKHAVESGDPKDIEQKVKEITELLTKAMKV
jgi:DNA-binding FrmR family transcriptional regulator